MPAVTITSSYGAGGSSVAASVAEQLGFALLDRAIPVVVAERLSVPIDQALARDEHLESGFGALVARVSASLAPFGGVLPPEAFGEDAFKLRTEEVLRELASGPGAVIFGRAGAVVLREWPDVLHVRLDGPVGARIQQGAKALGLSEPEAERQLQATDTARARYVRHFYGADWTDPALYHLWLDSTVIAAETCAAIVVTAARAHLGLPAPDES